MVLHQFKNGDILYRQNQALILGFEGNRRVLSTAAHNGGYKEDLKYVFNHDCKENGRKDTPLKATTYAEHMAIIAAELGLESAYACGLSTAADMDNVAIIEETYTDLTVTAVVTGGIDANGGRVGDPAQWHESDGICFSTPGTINIILIINANLPEGTMARALVTCTEAKTAALQELLAPSLYSTGIATGSGTDGTIIVANPTSPLRLTFAGKHAKLGELIGRTVMKAVKQALYQQTGLCAAQQNNIFSRIGRYGITRYNFLDEFPSADTLKLDEVTQNSVVVVLTSLYVHLLDQLQWSLISPPDAAEAAAALLENMGFHAHALRGTPCPDLIEKALLQAYKQFLQHLL